MPLLLERWYTSLWLSIITPSDTPLQWHHRLEHHSRQKLRWILPIVSSITTLDCESCQLKKHYHAFYSSHINNRSSSLFYLVCSDIWRPCRVTSMSGLRYFLVFVDDYSIIYWVYLLKNRTQVPNIIKSFINQIKT